jgi:EAL domain-containing protein (putative c-di-GMP-specific phosphodiesterase class I)
VSEIKIDRAFVCRIGESRSAAGIVRAVAELAHALGMRAVAEGVQTESEARLLSELGCDGAQGRFVAAAMQPLQATEWLLAHQSKRLPGREGLVIRAEVVS